MDLIEATFLNPEVFLTSKRAFNVNNVLNDELNLSFKSIISTPCVSA